MNVEWILSIESVSKENKVTRNVPKNDTHLS